MQGNGINSTRGLESLQSLVELDIRFNLLASLREVARLSGTWLARDGQGHASSCSVSLPYCCLCGPVQAPCHLVCTYLEETYLMLPSANDMHAAAARQKKM